MIRIYGASDDLCEIEGVDFDGKAGEQRAMLGVAKRGQSDEIGCYDHEVRFLIGDVEDPKVRERTAQGCRVWVRYAGKDMPGVWSVEVFPIDEDVPCPWPVRVRFEGYTAIAEIDAPDGTTVAYEIVEARGQ